MKYCASFAEIKEHAYFRLKPFRQTVWEYNGQVSKHSVTPNIGIPVSVKRGLRATGCGLQTPDRGKINADCRLKVKRRLGVKCRKNHIRAKIRDCQAENIMEVGLVFPRNPETSLPTLPLSNGTGNEIDETWRGTHVGGMLCVNHLFYQLSRF